ncbi:hypothetical protein BU16DRAFT_576314 [Lophium mytilinum]|uniref:Extracellular membrane protein CFEM domain-containing protein n=1 Tax=Lophium mytilinum TaxID=390894 RepID=A0A6A6RCK6_9PEZI|nr:hypothetical protein BU16DRAFT_576314 [Lophium mytilinum]
MKNLVTFTVFLVLSLATPTPVDKSAVCYCEPPICALELITECKCKNAAALSCYTDYLAQGIACPSPTPSPCGAILIRTKFPIPTSTATAIHCGGLLGLPCPEGFICIDDTSDSCDHRNGGTGCNDVCVYRETTGKIPCGGFEGVACW